MLRRFTSIAFAMSILSGCSGSLQTVPDLTRTHQLTEALPGASYALPKLEYDLAVRQYLASCPGEVSPEGKASRLSFAIEVKAKPRYLQGERYLVDFSKLGGVARTGKFDIEWHPNGTLKSLGAVGDDKTGEIIVDLTKTALSVWSIGAGGIRASSANASEEGSNLLPSVTHITCSTTAAADVALLNAKVGMLEKAKGKAEEIVKYTERAMSRAALRVLTKGDRERLSARFEELDVLEAEARVLNAEIEKIKGRLGTTVKLNWSGNYRLAHDAQGADLNIPAQEAIKLWRLLVASIDSPHAALLADAEASDAPSCYGESATVPACFNELTAVASRLATDAPIQAHCTKNKVEDCINLLAKDDPAAIKARDPRPDRGVFVRDPVIGRLLVCRVGKDPCGLANDEAGLEPSYMPQFGQLRFIPFVVRPFEGRSLSLQLAEDGRVTKLSYSTDKAMLATMAKAAADITGQVDAALDKRETKRRADHEYHRAQAIQAEQDGIDAINRQLAMKEAVAKRDNPLAPMTAETVQLQTESALITARRTKLEAEAALLALTTPSN